MKRMSCLIGLSIALLATAAPAQPAQSSDAPLAIAPPLIMVPLAPIACDQDGPVSGVSLCELVAENVPRHETGVGGTY